MARGLKIALGLVLLIAVSIVALPKLLSTGYVKERISAQLSTITGRPVTLVGTSSVSLRPYLSVSYRDVRIADTTPGSKAPLVRMDALRAKLSVFSALWGGARLAELHMVRPEISLRIDADGTRNWALEKGPLAERLNIAEGEVPAALSLGAVTLEDGKASFNDARTGNSQSLTSMNGTLEWPSINSAANLEGSAIYSGEMLSGNATLASPFAWLRGQVSDFDLTIDSNIAQGQFDGSYSWKQAVADGTLTAEIKSTERLATWLGAPLEQANLPKRISVSGKLNAAGRRMEFLDSSFSFEDHPATGRMLAILNDEGRLKVSGTLAFDTITLPGWQDLEAMHQLTADGEGGADDSPFGLIDVDLRLSANQATSPPFELSNLAAAVLVRRGNASFDIGQANVLGGDVLGSISYTVQQTTRRIAANLAFDSVDLAGVSALYGQPVVSLSGQGRARFNLKASGKTFDDMMRHLNGEGSIEARSGSIIGVDLPSILETTTADGNRSLPAMEGSTPYETLKLKFYVANGTAFWNTSVLENTELLARLGGRADITVRSLALSGALVPVVDGTAQEDAALPFFVGGTTSAPLFVPLPNSKGPAMAPAAPLLEREGTVEEDVKTDGAEPRTQ